MIGTDAYRANALRIGSVRSSCQSFKAAKVLTPIAAQYRSSTRTNSATCSVLSESITAPERCSSVQLVPPGSSTTAFPPSSYIPTCIDARVRKLGLKNTSATDFPASGFETSSPLLKRKAASSRLAICSRDIPIVFSKSVFIRGKNKLIHLRFCQTQRRQQSQ